MTQFSKKIQWRRDTLANWEAENPVLLDGEIVIVRTDGGTRLKIGDGVANFTSLPYQDDLLRTLIDGKVDKVDGKGLSANDFTDAYRAALERVNDLHAFRSVVINGAEITAEDVAEVLAFIAGENVSIDVNSETGEITISAVDTTYQAATSKNDGLMTADDKTKLDTVESGANKYVHPANAGNKHIPAGGSKGQILRWSSAGTAEWDNELAYGNATPYASGLMSTLDKTKLDGVAYNANNYVHPDTAGSKHVPAGGESGQILRWSSDGIATWGEETTYGEVTSTSAGLMSPADKVKLDGIAAGSGGGTEYVHPTGSGYNHIPAGGKEGQILRWKSDGTAEWGEDEGVSDDVVIDVTPTDDGIKVTKGDGTVTEIEISGGGEPEVIPGAVDSTCEDDGDGNVSMSSYGYLPTVEATDIDGGVRLSITDVNGTRTVDVMDGEQGVQGIPGESPSISVKAVSGGNELTIDHPGGMRQVVIIPNGSAPAVTIEEIDDGSRSGSRVTIYGGNGPRSFDVMDGLSGVHVGSDEPDSSANVWIDPNGDVTSTSAILRVRQNDGTWVEIPAIVGPQGEAGNGIESIVQTTASTADGGTNVITITLSDGTTATFNVKNGSKGSNGYSPTVDVEEVDGGYRLDITDVNGTQSVNIAAPNVTDSASGSAVIVTDAADSRPLRKLSIFGKTTQATTTGKNLFDPSQVNTLGFSDATTITSLSNCRGYYMPIVAGTTYTVSRRNTSDFNRFRVGFTVDVPAAAGKLIDASINRDTSKVITAQAPANANYLVLYFSNESATITGEMVQVEVGAAATEWEPYTGGAPSPSPDYPQPLNSVGDDGDVKVGCIGKNLFNGGDLSFKAMVRVQLEYPLPPGIYNIGAVIDSEATDSQTSRIILLDADGKDNGTVQFARGARSVASKTLKKTIHAITFWAGDASSTSTGKACTWKDIMISRDGESTDFEPYKGQTLTLSTPNGLPGIPVDSNGNYTDEDGQQWICDEVDLERGVNVQRIGKFDMGALDWEYSTNGATRFESRSLLGMIEHTATSRKARVLCDSYTVDTADNAHKGLSTAIVVNTTVLWVHDLSRSPDAAAFKAAMAGVMLLCPLTTPIETPLSDEEIAAYKALTTHYPTTTIYNDEAAEMEVRYANRNNIDEDSISFRAQTLTEAQKAQARENIGVEDAIKSYVDEAILGGEW